MLANPLLTVRTAYVRLAAIFLGASLMAMTPVWAQTARESDPVRPQVTGVVSNAENLVRDWINDLRTKSSTVSVGNIVYERASDTVRNRDLAVFQGVASDTGAWSILVGSVSFSGLQQKGRSTFLARTISATNILYRFDNDAGALKIDAVDFERVEFSQFLNFVSEPKKPFSGQVAFLSDLTRMVAASAKIRLLTISRGAPGRKADDDAHSLLTIAGVEARGSEGADLANCALERFRIRNRWPLTAKRKSTDSRSRLLIWAILSE